ncbi:hypothetical protein F0U59_34415 [Archangium gephyra]|nr:hypothetical protein F0U59_34415 [Archangium gephyra]
MSLILFTQLSFPAAGFIMGACFGAAYDRSDVARILVGAGLGGIAGGFSGVAAHVLLWGGLITLARLLSRGA